MTYTVSFTSSAARDIRALDPAMQRRVGKAIDTLVTSPRPDGVQKLRGSEEMYRIRIGDYRIIYQIEDRNLLITVVRVRHRREAYR